MNITATYKDPRQPVRRSNRDSWITVVSTPGGAQLVRGQTREESIGKALAFILMNRKEES